MSERVIKVGYPQNTQGIVLPHLPDGALELDEDSFVKMADGILLPFRRGDRLAIEVERSRKDFHRLERDSTRPPQALRRGLVLLPPEGRRCRPEDP